MTTPPAPSHGAPSTEDVLDLMQHALLGCVAATLAMTRGVSPDEARALVVHALNDPEHQGKPLVQAWRALMPHLVDVSTLDGERNPW